MGLTRRGFGLRGGKDMNFSEVKAVSNVKREATYFVAVV